MARSWASEVDVAEVGWRLDASGELRWEEGDDGAAGGYSPASAGDFWMYSTRQGEGAAIETCERVVSAAWVGDAWVARLRSEHVGNPAADSERSLIVTVEGVSPDIGEMTTGIGPVRVLSTHGVFLPRAPRPGQRWSWGQRLTTPLAEMEVEGTGEAVGEVAVKVPAGRFVAMLVRGESYSRVTMHAPKGAPAIEHRQQDEGWVVRGLGLVRHCSLGATGQGCVKELHRYAVRGAPIGEGCGDCGRRRA